MWPCSYHLVMTNSLPWKIHRMFKNGKPSISMGHLYHGELLNNQRVSFSDSNHPTNRKVMYQDFSRSWLFVLFFGACYKEPEIRCLAEQVSSSQRNFWRPPRCGFSWDGRCARWVLFIPSPLGVSVLSHVSHIARLLLCCLNNYRVLESRNILKIEKGVYRDNTYDGKWWKIIG